MNNQQQAYAATSAITKRYMQKICPYEIIVQSIALQNRQIYELQKKYLQMLELVKTLPEQKPEDNQFLKTREQKLIEERKNFMQEALVQNQLNYKAEYQRKKAQLQDQIKLLQSDIDIQGGSKINIFMNLNQGTLEKLEEENKGDEDILANVKYWKQAYQRSKKALK